MPPGVRFMESNVALDPDRAGPFRASQLYHLDIHDTPLVYVLVLVEDATAESGPWTFLPASVSARAKAALRYQQPGTNYRVTDEQMYSVIDPTEVISFTGKKGLRALHRFERVFSLWQPTVSSAAVSTDVRAHDPVPMRRVSDPV